MPKQSSTYLKPYNLFDFRIKTTFISYRCKPQNVKQNFLDLINLIAPHKISLSEVKDYHLKTLPANQSRIEKFLSTLPDIEKIMLNTQRL